MKIVLAFSALALGAATVSGQGAAPQPDTTHQPYTAADVSFMTGMIAHHAQALLIAGWAPSHGASQRVSVLCERIVVAQTDEIVAMQRWLRERDLPVPDGKPSSGLAMAGMPGMDHAMMPGMLTAPQLAQLDSARGTQFDRLFLTFMIQHHQGALVMVDQLFGSTGALRDDQMYKFASDVSADQSTEIERMQKMLGAMPLSSPGAPK